MSTDVLAWQAVATLVAFFFIMLVVPWLLARDAARESSDRNIGEGAPLDAEPGRVFASARERRLWLWTGAVVLAIYLTLSPAQTLAAGLRERGLLGPITTAILLGAGAAVVLLWARTRPKTLEIGAALGVAAVYVTTVIRLPVPEARSHLFEYGLVAMLVHQALLERRESGRRVPAPALIAVLATALLGWIDEAIQAFLPTRVYDLRDVAFNAIAASMAVAASLIVRWVRRRANDPR